MDRRKGTNNTMERRKGTNNTMDRRKETDNTMDRRKGTNNDLQNIIFKTKDRVTRTPIKTGGSSLKRKGPESAYCKWNISVVICDTSVMILILN